MADIRAELRSKTKVHASIRQATGEAGTKQHSQLSGRDVPDQHPMSAITGLVSALAKKSDGMEITTKGLVYLTSGGERIAGPYGLFSPGDGEHSGPAYVASDEPPEDTDALWVNTSEPEEAIALGVTAEETAEGVDIYATDELGTKKVNLRHGRDGAPGKDYRLTDDDKHEIAGIAAGLVPGAGGVAVSRARVGQTIRVAAVDDSGKPTDWEAVEFPSIPFANAKAVLRIDAQIAPLEDGSYPKIYFTEDIDGNPLKMRAFCIITDWESSVSYSRLHFAKVAENRFEYATSVPQKWDARRPIVFSTSAHGILRMDSMYSNSRDTPINIPGETNPCGTWAGVSEVTGLGLSYVKSITFFRVYELIDEEVS